jgi:Gly-Xaa carboxypeptidase
LIDFTSNRHLWGSDTVVTPYLSTGGTDTRSFVNLTTAIFRFQAVRDTERKNVHTVDERVHTVRWISFSYLGVC